MKYLYAIALTLLLSACSSIKSVIEDPIVREKRLRTAIDIHNYSMSLKELKANLLNYWEDWHSAPTTHRKDQIVQDELDQGFTYKGRFFQKSDASFIDSLTSFSIKDQMLLKNLLVDEDYFVIEENLNSFRIVKDAHIYFGQKITDTTSSLQIHRINELKNGPLKINQPTLSLLKEQGHLALIEQGPIVLEKSLETAIRSTQLEFLTLKALDPVFAKEL